MDAPHGRLSKPARRARHNISQAQNLAPTFFTRSTINGRCQRTRRHSTSHATRRDAGSRRNAASPGCSAARNPKVHRPENQNEKAHATRLRRKRRKEQALLRPSQALVRLSQRNRKANREKSGNLSLRILQNFI